MSWLSTAQLPRPHDKARLDVAWTRWSEKAARPDDALGVALLDALFGNSPYLAETALQNPTFMTDLWRDGPDDPRLQEVKVDGARHQAKGCDHDQGGQDEDDAHRYAQTQPISSLDQGRYFQLLDDGDFLTMATS